MKKQIRVNILMVTLILELLLTQLINPSALANMPGEEVFIQGRLIITTGVTILYSIEQTDWTQVMLQNSQKLLEELEPYDEAIVEGKFVGDNLFEAQTVSEVESAILFSNDFSMG